MSRSASDTISLIDVATRYGGWETIPDPSQIWIPVVTTVTT
jgi:hypothetical protein